MASRFQTILNQDVRVWNLLAIVPLSDEGQIGNNDVGVSNLFENGVENSWRARYVFRIFIYLNAISDRRLDCSVSGNSFDCIAQCVFDQITTDPTGSIALPRIED